MFGSKVNVDLRRRYITEARFKTSCGTKDLETKRDVDRT